MTNDAPPRAALTPERWQGELSTLRERYPSARQHPPAVGAAIFEVTVTVEGAEHHLRMTLPPGYPRLPPEVREAREPNGAIIRPPGSRRFLDGAMCLFPHGSDPQGWNPGRCAADALAKAEELLALEHRARIGGGWLMLDGRTLMLNRWVFNAMRQAGTFGTLKIASLTADFREPFGIDVRLHEPSITCPAAIPAQWASLLTYTKEVPWACVRGESPPWDVILGSRAELGERLGGHVAPEALAHLLDGDSLVLVRDVEEAIDAVMVRRPQEDVLTLRISRTAVGNPDDVLFNRVDGVVSRRARLDEAPVALIGLGSLGGAVALALARAGARRFLLVDPDHLSIANVCRHVGTVRDVGRPKVEIVRDAILALNPAAEIAVVARPLAWDMPAFSAGLELARWLAEHPRSLVIATFVFAAVEQQLNELLVSHGIPAIYASVLGAGDHGRVFRVIPGETPCFECVLDAQDADPRAFPRFIVEGYDEHAHREYHEPSLPGLAMDIGHVALITARLALQTIARICGLDMALGDEDGHHLLWTNRGGWAFDRALQVRVERIPRNPGCRVCGRTT